MNVYVSSVATNENEVVLDAKGKSGAQKLKLLKQSLHNIIQTFRRTFDTASNVD